MPAQEQRPVVSSFKEKAKVPRSKEEELVSWLAYARPFKRRNREFYITLIAMAFIVGLVLFLAEGWLPVVLIISLLFLFYVMNTVEPEIIKYQITTRGIRIAGKRTDWSIMRHFWFTKRYDSELLVVGTTSLPGRMELVIDPAKKAAIRKTLLKYLPEEKVPVSFLDRAANWFSKKIPGS